MINARILPDGNLLLTAGNATRAWLKEMRETQDEVATLIHATEPYWTNGRFEPFDAGLANPFVGLTDAPCIAEEMAYNDDGTREVIGRLWWFPDYCIRSPTEELIQRGRTVFASGDQ